MASNAVTLSEVHAVAARHIQAVADATDDDSELRQVILTEMTAEFLGRLMPLLSDATRARIEAGTRRVSITQRRTVTRDEERAVTLSVPAEVGHPAVIFLKRDSPAPVPPAEARTEIGCRVAPSGSVNNIEPSEMSRLAWEPHPPSLRALDPREQCKGSSRDPPEPSDSSRVTLVAAAGRSVWVLLPFLRCQQVRGRVFTLKRSRPTGGYPAHRTDQVVPHVPNSGFVTKLLLDPPQQFKRIQVSSS